MSPSRISDIISVMTQTNKISVQQNLLSEDPLASFVNTQQRPDALNVGPTTVLPTEEPPDFGQITTNFLKQPSDATAVAEVGVPVSQFGGEQIIDAGGASVLGSLSRAGRSAKKEVFAIMDAVMPTIETPIPPIVGVIKTAASAFNRAIMLGQPLNPEEGALVSTLIEEPIRLAKSVWEDPIRTFEDEPVNLVLSMVGLLDVTGRAASIAGKTALLTKSIKLAERIAGNAKTAKTVLQEAGATRSVSKSLASRLAKATTPEDFQSVLADAVVLSKPRHAQKIAQHRLALAERDIEHLADYAKQAQKQVWDEFEAAKAQMFEEIKGAGPADRQRFVAEAKKKLKETQAAAQKIDDDTMRRTDALANIPQDPVPTIAQFVDAMKNQYRVDKATSLHDARLRGLDRHTQADLANTPIMDPFGPDGRLSKGLYNRGIAYLEKNFLTREKVTASVARMFGRESMIMSKTPRREAYVSEIKSAETSARMIEAAMKKDIDDVIRVLDDPDIDWVNAPQSLPDGTVSAQGREWMKAGRPDEWQGQIVPKNIKRMGDAMQKNYDRAHAAATRAWKKWDKDHRIGYLENYVPNEITGDARLALLARHGDDWRLLEDWAQSQRNIVDLEGIATRISPREAIFPTKKSAALDFERPLDLPASLTRPDGSEFKILETDIIKGYFRYVDNTSRRMASVQHFGPNGQGAKKMIEAMGSDFHGRQVAHDIWKSFQGIPEAPGAYTSAWGQSALIVETLGRTFQLSAAVVPNLTGVAWVARKWGLGNAIRAQKIVFEALSKEKYPESWMRIEANRALGGIAENVLNYLGETELVARGGGAVEQVSSLSRRALRLTGLGVVENNTNKVAGIAALTTVNDYIDIIRNGKRSIWSKMTNDLTPESITRELKRDFQFTDKDISRIIKDGLSRHDQARIVQTAPTLVNAWRQGSTSRYRLATHPIVQPILAYTSWVRVRGHMAADAVRELKHGNIGPMMKEIGYDLVTGEAVIMIKNYMRNRDRNDTGYWDRIQNDILESAGYGYWGSILESVKYTQDGLGVAATAWNILMPPAAGWTEDLHDVVGTAIKMHDSGRHKDAVRFLDAVLRAVPAAASVRGGVLSTARILEELGISPTDLGAQVERNKRNRSIRKRQRQQQRENR